MAEKRNMVETADDVRKKQWIGRVMRGDGLMKEVMEEILDSKRGLCGRSQEIQVYCGIGTIRSELMVKKLTCDVLAPVGLVYIYALRLCCVVLRWHAICRMWILVCGRSD